MELLEERQTKGFSAVSMSCGIDKRIEFLDLADRKLLEITVRGALSRREAGMLLGLSSGTVTRRLRVLVNRLHEPIVVALVDFGELLPELYREVGLAYFLRKWPMARIAREMGLTQYEVKRKLAYVRGWQKGVGGKDEGRRMKDEGGKGRTGGAR